MKFNRLPKRKSTNISPASEDTDTFAFWKEYSKLGNKARKFLAKLAQIYLAPAPTSVDMECLVSGRVNSWFMVGITKMVYFGKKEHV